MKNNELKIQKKLNNLNTAKLNNKKHNNQIKKTNINNKNNKSNKVNKKNNKNYIPKKQNTNVQINKNVQKQAAKKQINEKNKKNKVIEYVPLKKKENKREKYKKMILIILSLIIFLSLILFLIFKNQNDDKEINNLKKEEQEQETISYDDYFYEQVKLLNDKKIYKLINGEFIIVGLVYKDLVFNLEKDEFLAKGYFKIKDTEYYIDYLDLVFDDSSFENSNNSYLNYIFFNESIKTLGKTNLYLDDKLIYTFFESMTFPILIKEDDSYGVMFQDKLFYIKKDECEVFENNNTILKYTKEISVLTYHFNYDSSNKEEELKCKKSNVTICLSDKLFKDHLMYLKENNFYTATMKDLSLFIDGKIQLPENTVVITIDDGYYTDAMIKVLEEVYLHATLFLIGTAGSPSDYESKNLEIHSHTYNMHYPGACSGGQGSPMKCLNKEKILEDLRKSREQLNGSTVFCYPFFEYNDYAINILKEAGFEMAFIGGRRKIKVGSNKYKLPRYGIINTTSVEDIKQIVN